MKFIKIILLQGISCLINYKKETKRNEMDNNETITAWILDSKEFFLCSAELASMYVFMNEHKEYQCELDFICTETSECMQAAKIIANVLKIKYQDRITECRTIQIPGLCMDDIDQFLNVGVTNLIETVGDLTQGYHTQEVVINITGGYKAIIPYITLIAQMKGFELFYLYEKTNRLAYISPMVTIDMNRYKNILSQLKEEEGEESEI